MSSNNASGKVVSVDAQAFEQTDDGVVAFDGFEVVDETPTFQATVEQETQAKVDANHPEGIADTSDDRIHGVTLKQEERIRAREAELERISAEADEGTQDGRAECTRVMVAERTEQRRMEFQKRAASVDPMADPERDDPRETLTQEELAAVNEHSIRLADELDSWSQAAIGRLLGEAVAAGTDVMTAVIELSEALQTAPGQIIPIDALEDVGRNEVSIEGHVTLLWETDSPAIQQVGLIEDDTGRTKFTSWVASDQPWIEEGERVRIHGAAKNWYNGRVSVALTGWTTLHFPERDGWRTA